MTDLLRKKSNKSEPTQIYPVYSKVKEHGTIGAHGELALQHVIAQEPGVDQGPIRAICHAMGLIMRQQAVKVRS